MKTGETLSTNTSWTPEAFHRIVEMHHQALYRYFALHTKADLQAAYQLTKETFLVLYLKCPSIEYKKGSFRSELLGTAWDVWNAHYSRKDCRANVANYRFDLEIDTRFPRMLQILRCLPFYPRETFYLRFFAGLDTKDIAYLMDKNETAIKIMVYQALMQFASGMSGTDPVTLSWKEFLLLAQEYDHYLADMLMGIKPQHGIREEAFYATRQLQALRESISMTPEALSALTREVERDIQPVQSYATPL